MLAIKEHWRNDMIKEISNIAVTGVHASGNSRMKWPMACLYMSDYGIDAAFACWTLLGTWQLK